jgi:hypothetical protein
MPKIITRALQEYSHFLKTIYNACSFQLTNVFSAPVHKLCKWSC